MNRLHARDPEQVNGVGHREIVKVHDTRSAQGLVMKIPAVLDCPLDDQMHEHSVPRIGKGDVPVRLPELHHRTQQCQTNEQAGNLHAGLFPEADDKAAERACSANVRIGGEAQSRAFQGRRRHDRAPGE